MIKLVDLRQSIRFGRRRANAPIFDTQAKQRILCVVFCIVFVFSQTQIIALSVLTAKAEAAATTPKPLDAEQELTSQPSIEANQKPLKSKVKEI